MCCFGPLFKVLRKCTRSLDPSRATSENHRIASPSKSPSITKKVGRVGFLGHIFHCVSLFHAIKVNTPPRHKHCYYISFTQRNSPICQSARVHCQVFDHLSSRIYCSISFSSHQISKAAPLFFFLFLLYLCHKSFCITFNPLKSYFGCVSWLGHNQTSAKNLKAVGYLLHSESTETVACGTLKETSFISLICNLRMDPWLLCTVLKSHFLRDTPGTYPS